ncbi:hypothetical protein DBV15_02926 [Temnothorax longispinosus]|uniref:Uncharacterized protein n=1 Tax=Temnothorax longispinosus TaxID=300112 RepID=A0A4S2JQF5_9HYME|nr:hypothetical protein DBV15_02926 [Temnothorax longispinosus]
MESATDFVKLLCQHKHVIDIFIKEQLYQICISQKHAMDVNLLSLLLARLVEAVLDSPGPPVPPASPLMLEPASEAVGVTGAERLLTFVKALSNLCMNASTSDLFMPNAAAAVRYGTL